MLGLVAYTILAPRKQRQEDQEFEASLSYTRNSRTAGHESLSQSKQPKNNRNKTKTDVQTERKAQDEPGQIVKSLSST